MKASASRTILTQVFVTAITVATINSVAIAQSTLQTDHFTTQLWAPNQPVCILAHNPNHEKLELPQPYSPPTIQEIYGPGITEDNLVTLTKTQDYLRPQKVAVGDNVVLVVTYGDDANEGFNDPVLGALRRAAFEHGMNVWAANLQGPATISISATMTALGGSGTGALLASAAPAGFFRTFRRGFVLLAPIANTWYPEALVEIITGIDPNNNRLDINVTFNSDVDNDVVLGDTGFYYGTDANPGTDIDFVTITIHELCHGFGFSDSFDDTGNFGDFLPSPRNPTVFDHFLVNGAGTPLISLTASPDNVTGDNVFWSGLHGRYAFNKDFGGTGDVPMFAPTPFQGESSISHLDEFTFDGIWELQTPDNSSAVHTPDLIVMGILQDIGHSLPHSRYVDINANGFEDGSSAHPFNNLIVGIDRVPDQGIVRILPGNYLVPKNYSINRIMQLRSSGGVVVIGAQ